MVMLIDVHARKLTDDPLVPYPWKWNVEADTIYGHLRDEGLCATREDCPVEAKRHILNWIADQKVALSTRHVFRIEIRDE